jgi:hypothetical protein
MLRSEIMDTESITIQVPPKVAEAYRAADAEGRRKFDLMIGFQIEDALEDPRSLQDIMRDISRKARERGLTPEILEKILNEP